MKKFDLVKLKNDKPYKTYNLVKDMHGIVVELNFDKTLVNKKSQKPLIILEI